MIFTPITGPAAKEISRLLDIRPGRGRQAMVEPNRQDGYASFTAHGKDKRGQDCYAELRLYDGGGITLTGAKAASNAPLDKLAQQVLSLAQKAAKTLPDGTTARQRLQAQAFKALTRELKNSRA